MLAPHELKNKSFGKSLKGYNVSEVDDYINFLIDKYTEVYRENIELDRKLRIVVTNLDEIRDEEESIRNTLVSAQKMGEKIIRDANERADIITESIKKRCDAVIEDFKAQIAKEKEELWNVRATVLDFKKKLFEAYRQQIEDVRNISVNELEELVLPSDSELVGKIFGEVKATIEEEIREERVRREQEEIIRRAEAEKDEEEKLDEADLVAHFKDAPSSDTIILSADEMPIEAPDDGLRALLEDVEGVDDDTATDATVIIPEDIADNGTNICSDEEMYKLFSEDEED
ncbi:MAG: DivIVA domain-containing protein [Clostridia bacterium]|nr:DivIVA domain-containing protein [Clostridia bacterium]